MYVDVCLMVGFGGVVALTRIFPLGHSTERFNIAILDVLKKHIVLFGTNSLLNNINVIDECFQLNLGDRKSVV